ncbi:Ribosomal small subunit pseudouridine synthase A [Pediococcus damnosus]|uniref:Pseudouridine synthase n=1 Tax=Pediococcus damnosus TaxID=51663 RepID=A0A143B1R1_9LACO|nr:pseudouridine synthase [Pediococcus damnosus]AMV61306.1 Ribosomal small subunit pseudouridine synthase A [Pediococcus damnosus]AMV62338.1 Ribosomal small subunit pseudouridine synthase A [Pediococcus damnosus]AMV65666.1 Ribosomal small subunit pseudouridine synthase A [Pediococcus damnosus]AMV67801.1 Ribosomal small subunit pseudouridine synthase A [Pediococcus damnosus]AMV70009.1 Ribosomal small subunit pseudouridine synthase A [Pediococcus damnosus]
MRVDKFLHQMNVGTRNQITQLIKKGRVTLNAQRVRTGKTQLNPGQDLVKLGEQEIKYQVHYYYVLNKPMGVISASTDTHQKTVMDLFNKSDYRSDLFPVGRLDKDTEGLLLITNDGDLAHKLLSPAHHIKKTYEATVTGKLDESVITKFAEGILLKDGTQLYPAKLEILNYNKMDDTTNIHVQIQEGKYHQVRRMFGAVGQKVIHLQRIKMGTLAIDEGLLPGNYRELTQTEVDDLLRLTE